MKITVYMLAVILAGCSSVPIYTNSGVDEKSNANLEFDVSPGWSTHFMVSKNLKPESCNWERVEGSTRKGIFLNRDRKSNPIVVPAGQEVVVVANNLSSGSNTTCSPPAAKFIPEHNKKYTVMAEVVSRACRIAVFEQSSTPDVPPRRIELSKAASCRK